MPLKVQFIFRGGVGNGWTETFYLASGGIQTIQATINRFVSARSPCLGAGTTIEGARVTDPAFVGAAGWYPVNPINVFALQPALGQDLVQSTVLLRIQTTDNLYRRSFEMSGIPDDWLVWNNGARSYLIIDAGRTAITTFGNRLINEWSMYVIDKGAAAVNLKPVQGVAFVANPDGFGGVVTITSNNHGYATGDTVRISKVQGSAVQVAKGTFEITSVAANTFTYNTAVNPIPPVVWIRGGDIRRQRRLIVPIGEVQILRVGNRKRGRQFFVQRGRRRANR